MKFAWQPVFLILVTAGSTSWRRIGRCPRQMPGGCVFGRAKREDDDMKVYCLHIHPDESDESKTNRNEYFSSLAAAEKRRANLIAEDPNLDDHPLGSDYAIWSLTLAKLPTKKLVLAILNGVGYVVKRDEVVPDYLDPEMQKYLEERQRKVSNAS